MSHEQWSTGRETTTTYRGNKHKTKTGRVPRENGGNTDDGDSKATMRETGDKTIVDY